MVILIDARPAWFAQRAASMVASGLLTTTGSSIGGVDRIPTMWLEDVDLIQRTEVERLEEREDGWTARTRDGRCLMRGHLLHGALPAIVGDVGFRHCPGSTPDLHAHVDGDGRRNQLPAIRWHRGLRGGARRDSHRRSGGSRRDLSFGRGANGRLEETLGGGDPCQLRLKQEWVEGAAWLEESVARAHRWRYGRARSGATCDRIGPRSTAGDAHGPVPGTVGASLASRARRRPHPHRCAHETRFGVP